MKNQRTYILAAALSTFTYSVWVPQKAEAVTIASWSIDGRSLTGGTTGNVSGPTVAYNAEVGTGTLFGVHTNTATLWSFPAGNGSVASMSGTAWNVNTTYWEFQLNSGLYANILVGFDQLSSSTGPRNWTLQYKTAATDSYSNYASYNLGYNSTGGLITWSGSTNQSESHLGFDLSAITALNQKPQLFFRLLVSGSQAYGTGTATFASTGTSRIDNIVVSGTAVPEPSTGAIAIAAAAAAVGATRKRKRS